MNPKMLIKIVLLVIAFSCNIKTNAQNVQSSLDKVYTLIEEGQYEEGYKILQGIDKQRIEESGDSCIMMYNYEKGSCLYFMDKYKEAIPYLEKALLSMEKNPSKDCTYLELIYGIGSCYNNLSQYTIAEKYFRRVIIRGNTINYSCGITTQTISELTEVYKKLGYNKLANECANKINMEVNNISNQNWYDKVEGLFDLANSLEEQEKYDEEHAAYREILTIIESNIGKINEDYLVYSSIYSQRLIQTNKIKEAITILEDMINIGESLTPNSDLICNAYENYLLVLATINKTEDISKVLPIAIKYMKNTPNYEWVENNLHEMVGNEFCNIKEYATGISWLEKPWNGKVANTIRGLTNLGNYYFKTAPEKALSYFLKAEKQIQNAGNDETKKFIYENIMYLYASINQYKEAVLYANKSAYYIKSLSDNDYYARHLINWATYCQKNGDLEKTEVLLNEIETLFPLLAKETRASFYTTKGFIYISEKQYDKSIKVINEGISMITKELGESSQWLTTMYHNLGRAYMLKKDFGNALLYLNKSKNLQIQINGKAMERTLEYLKECEER